MNPAATERCDGIDNNCDGSTDGSDSIDASTWFADLDSDGFGDLSNTTKACSQPSSYTSDNSDCNDTTALAAPGLTEVCADGLDNDCDGTANSCDLNGDINLTSADGKHSGESAYDYSAYTVAGVGDINGDGLDDVVSGAWLEDAGRKRSRLDVPGVGLLRLDREPRQCRRQVLGRSFAGSRWKRSCRSWRCQRRQVR